MRLFCLLLTLMLGFITGCSNPLPPPPTTSSAQGSVATNPTPALTAANTTLATATPAAIPTETTPPTPVETAAEADPTDQGLNLLVDVSGEVQLKRVAWPGYRQTGFGVGLRRGDLLKLAAGAEAVILCDNLTLWRVPGGPAPAGLNGCPRPEAPPSSAAGSRSPVPVAVTPTCPISSAPVRPSC